MNVALPTGLPFLKRNTLAPRKPVMSIEPSGLAEGAPSDLAAFTASGSLKGRTIVYLAKSAGTPALSGFPKVSAPLPAGEVRDHEGFVERPSHEQLY